MAARKTETGCRPDTLMGLWCVEPQRLQQAWAIVKDVDLAALQAEAKANPLPSKPLYTKRDGVATVELSGLMTKYPSSFQALLGGSSTLQTREALRAANADDDVRRIMLLVESPGGSVNGVAELYDSVASSKKPVHAHIEDIGASAALWVASAAKTVTANRAAKIGSIGSYAAVQDTSGAMAKEGIVVHVVSSGGAKGGIVDGAPVTDEALAEVKALVDATTDLFVSEVAQGRRLSKKKVQAMADGRMHLAAAAQELGLIDGIASFDEAFLSLSRKAMNEEQLLLKVEADTKALADLKAQLASQAEQVTALLAKDKANEEALAAVAREKALAVMTEKLAALKGLPNAGALAAVFVALSPEHSAALLTQFGAWNAQAKTAGLFAEIGSAAGGDNAVDLNNPEAFRAAADAAVAAGTFKDRPAAQKAMLAAAQKGGN